MHLDGVGTNYFPLTHPLVYETRSWVGVTFSQCVIKAPRYVFGSHFTEIVMELNAFSKVKNDGRTIGADSPTVYKANSRVERSTLRNVSRVGIDQRIHYTVVVTRDPTERARR